MAQPHSVVQAVAAWARRTPDRVAIRAASHRDLSYADLAVVLGDVVGGLAGAGIGEGDVVALFLAPGSQTAVLTAAVMSVACAAPLNPALPAPALDAALARLRPRLLIVSPAAPAWVAQTAARHGVTVGTAATYGSGRAGAVRLSVRSAVPDGPARPALPADCALLLQTSGSTGTPKLVPLTRSQVDAAAGAVVDSLGLDSGDTALHTLPMHHVGGIVDLLAAPLKSGGAVVVSTPFAAPAVLAALDSATWLQLAPAMVLELLEQQGRSGTAPPAGLRLVRSVSAPLPEALLHRAEAALGVPVIEIYGMTETAGVITSNPLDGRRPGTVGRPVGDLEIAACGPDGTALPAGQPGEIRVRGGRVTNGYLDAAGGGSADGWFGTGDLGVIDPDGYLRITGRVKDAVNRGGEMISPAVVDRVLLDHPDVVDAAAFGAPHPSLGEILAAAVVIRAGAAVEPADLQAWVAERLPPAMVPRPVVVVDAIPRAEGKLRRHELTTLLPAPTGGGTPGSAVGAALADLWQSVLGVTAIGPDDDFFAVGGDSLRAAALVARLSELTGDIVYVSAVFDAPTLSRFEQQLQRNYPRAAAALAGGVVDQPPHVPVTAAMIDRFRALIRQSDPGPVSPRNPRCAFLLSAPRSGSTLLRSMLAGHPGLFAPPELYLLAYRDLAERSRHFPPPWNSQLEGAVRALMQAEGVDAATAARRITDLESAGVTTSEFYGLLQRAVPGRLLVDKTPANALSENTLLRAEQEFTEPVYIHLVRHPSAMVASFVEANLASLWAPRILGPDAAPELLGEFTPGQLGELLWITLNATIEQFLAGVPAQRVVRVRYEDLVADPAATLRPVCEVLGVDYSPQLLDPYDGAPERMTDGLHEQSRMIGDPKFHRHSGIDPSRGQRWRTDGAAIGLSDAARDMATRYGYPDAQPEAVLTPGQARIRALSRLNPDSSVYNVPLAFRLSGELDLIALDRALTALQQRHAALRASFPLDEDGHPRQVIAAPTPVVAPLKDCSWVRNQNDPQTAERELLRFAEQTARAPFDLESGPLWRAAVFQEDDRTHLLAMAFHHIIVDGLSRAVLLADLGELYSAAVSGRAGDLPPAVPYPTVLARQAAADAGRADEDSTYWQSRFDPPPSPLLLPTDHSRPPGPGRARSVTVSVDRETAGAAVQFCRDRGVTPAALWLASTAVLLRRWTGQTDQVICVPTSGRHSVAAESTVGYFNRIVPVRLDLPGDPAVGDVVGQAMRRIGEAVAHDGTALQDMASLPGVGGAVLSTALVSYQKSPAIPLTLPGLEVRAVPLRKDASDFDIAVHIEDTPSEVRVVIDYHCGLFGADTIAAMARLLPQTVGLIVGSPSAPVSALPGCGVDLAEVEARLAAHPKVDDCAVVAGAGRLDAYLVLNEFDVPTLEEITDHARGNLPAHRVPSAFVTVDRLPRTADGALDPGGLPTPLQANPTREVTGPRDDLEHAIAACWRSVLWFDGEIGVHDSFRALGGHSLLAVRLVAELEMHLGHPVPTAALRHLDTIAGLADALREGPEEASASSGSRLAEEILHGLLTHTATWAGVRHSETAVTVGLNTEGTRPALFWCLQNDFEHRSLAYHLGPDQPVYAMRSGNRVMVKSDENIDLLARHYVEEILQIQPAGPYILGGNCQAARIAIRIANHLRARGHEVPLLFMMEKFDPVPYPGAVAMLFGRDSDRNPYLEFTEPQTGYRKWFSGPLWIRQMTGAHGQFFDEPNIVSLAGLIDEHLRGLADPAVLPRPAPAAGPAPPPLTADAYRAVVDLLGRPVVGAGSIRLEVEVTNRGARTWPAGPAGGVGLGYRWIPEGAAAPGILAGVQAFDAEVAPGGRLTMAVEVAAPDGDGAGFLEVDVVEQGVTWFGDRGSQPLRVAVEVADGTLRTL